MLSQEKEFVAKLYAVETQAKDSANQKVIDACLNQNVRLLKLYHAQGIDFNRIRDPNSGLTLLHLAIGYDKPLSFSTLIELGVNIEVTSLSAGNTPLNYAAKVGALKYVDQLIALGANVNAQAFDGYTPLNNAVYYINYDIASTLLKIPTLDVNIPSHDQQLPIMLAYLDERYDVLELMIEHPSYDVTFNQIIISNFPLPELSQYLPLIESQSDEMIYSAFLRMKIFGAKYDFDGCFTLSLLTDHQHNCLPYEGFSNHLGVFAFAHSYHQFLSTVVQTSTLPEWAFRAFLNVDEALTFAATHSDSNSYLARIHAEQPTLITSGWSGHAIDFVIHGERLYRCNRGFNSNGKHGIEEFIITKPHHLDDQLIQFMLDADGDPYYLQTYIVQYLGLEKVGAVVNPAQTVGNCVWVSLEAGLEALLISCILEEGIDSKIAHNLAKDCFSLWEEYDLSSALIDVIQAPEALIQNDVYDDLLIKVIQEHHDAKDQTDIQKGVVILNQLHEPSVFAAFDQEIGQYVMKYDPHSYSNISYMASYVPSNWDYYLNYIIAPNFFHPENEKILAKEYYDFLVACDAYQQNLDSSVITITDVIELPTHFSLEALFQETVRDLPQETKDEQLLPIGALNHFELMHPITEEQYI